MRRRESSFYRGMVYFRRVENRMQGRTREACAAYQAARHLAAAILLVFALPGGAALAAAAAPAATGAVSAVPSPPASTADGKGIKLFGTVEFRRPLSTLPGWLDVLERNAASPIFTPERQFNRKTTWAMLREQARGKNGRELLRLVNTFWNGWPYREDQANWGKPDYWEIPAQFLKKSGDCEDYAIVKYFTLRELGIAPSQMRIVVLRDTIRNLAHAVLVVYLDGEAYVLDNLSNVIQPHTRLRHYSPQYSVNETGRWTHIRGRGAASSSGRPARGDTSSGR